MIAEPLTALDHSPMVPPPGWAIALRRWTDYATVIGLSPITIQDYRRRLVNFVADTLIDLCFVTEEDIVGYVAGLAAQGSARTQVLKAFRSYGSWAEGRIRPDNPALKLKPKRQKYGPAPALSEDELTRIVIAAGWREARRAWAILFMYATGVRLSSACAIRPEDVHGDILFIRIAKGNRPYSISLGPLGQTAFRGLLDTRRPGTDTLFGAANGRVWQWVHQAGQDTGIHVHPHMFRHTWATRHLEMGTDVRVLQELGNWADLSQIPRYTTVTDPRKREAQAKF